MRSKVSSSALFARTVPRSALSEKNVEDMWKLFDAYYADVSLSSFTKDLSDKDHVILLFDRKDRSLRGFSTLAVYRRELAGRPFQVVFSGDTIVDRAYWGQTALQRAFLSFVIHRKLRRPNLPTYWFLITKGYKTYLLLARNFLEYWPRYDQPLPELERQRIELLARDRFGDAFRADRGILVFDPPLGRLREEAAPIDARALRLDEVRFFVERNPNHASGEELCCTGKIDGALWVHYMSKLGRRAVRRLRSSDHAE